MAAPPSFDVTTRLVARTLGMRPGELEASLRPAIVDDLPAVLALRQEGIAAQIRWNDRDYLTWRYRLGREDAGLGELWVVVRDGQLLGMVGAENMACKFDGRQLAGQRTMDILVAPTVRDSGLGIWLNQALFRNAEFTLAVGANQNSIGTVTRLFRMLPQRCTYVHPVDLNHYLARRFNHQATARTAAWLGNAAMACWRGAAKVVGDGGLEIGPILRFDEGFDGVNVPRPERAGDVTVDRSSRYLNRRLFENPRARYKVCGALDKSGHQGYLASRIATREDGTKWMHIIDITVHCAERRSPVVGALLSLASQEATREGCTTVAVTVQGEADRAVLLRHGYFAQSRDEATIVGVYAESPLLDGLTAADWSLTDLSVDHDGY